MTETRSETVPAGPRRPGGTGGAASIRARTAAARRRPLPEAATLADDRRLARLHLRLGDLSLARAELENLRRRGELDAECAADLAEARWRSGDLVGAAGAAGDHLAQRGRHPTAIVIAAEAAAAAGQPGEVRAHMEALGAVDAPALEALFAGMPRRAFWPSAPGAVPVTPDAGSPSPERVRRRAGGRLIPTADEMAGAPGAPGASGAASGTDPAEELGRARDELTTGNAADATRGLARLALVLRLDPNLAPAVLGVLGHRRDAAGLTVEGDACRLLGRHLEAEAAFAAARRALGAIEPERRT